jgi:hypothetical protein
MPASKATAKAFAAVNRIAPMSLPDGFTPWLDRQPPQAFISYSRWTDWI